MIQTIRNRMASVFCLLAFLAVMIAASAQAASDITGALSSVSGYVDAAITIGITVLLFVLGRKVVSKLV
ncbi:hypothetical protein [Staphylococcus aureus]|uniref:hypothetical protein n=1 Tax=Staphylococcus aureus TaxID=1280 RepID=UPI001582638F|nr:hypothetical protein [Staphylococcus aureus]